MKIAAVVVTYNRLNLLKECIEALRAQSRKIDEIFIINNSSTDGTEEWLTGQKDLTVITQPNSGGAGGFNTGMKKAYEAGYDWIWLMDDDAEPESNSLNFMLHFINEKIACICPDVFNQFNKRGLNHRSMINRSFLKMYYLQEEIKTKLLKEKILEIELTSFVGPLINRNAINKIGFPLKDFFIHYDDIEYSIRLLNYGKIVLLSQTRIIHKEPTSTRVRSYRFRNKIINRISFEDYWIKYFTLRNFFLVLLYHSKNNLSNYFSILFNIIREICLIFLFDDRKKRRIKLVLKAASDAFNNNLIDNSETIKSNLKINL